jgi:predicted NAD-dependent protein-ADP-ribosyltransferase YbiA (DUF1768 family)
MYPCNILNVYKSSEHFFQAALSADIESHNRIIETPDGWAAKRLARTLPRRADYKNVQVGTMAHALYLKFLYNLDIRSQLLATPSMDLVEQNEWHDNYWGSCTCARCLAVNHPKQNVLGQLLNITRTYFALLQSV